MSFIPTNRSRRKAIMFLASTILCVLGESLASSGDKLDQGLEKIVETKAIPSERFLNSLGICIHYAQGIDVKSYIEPLRYLGIKNIRDDFGDPQGYIYLKKQTDVKVDVIASTKNLDATINSLKQIAQEDALLAIEGPNEPNNFPIKYKDEYGGGPVNSVHKSENWVAVANFQKDLYTVVKNDKLLAKYPVFNTSEVGAQKPNLGLQFLEIPAGAATILPPGTKFADFLNVHNYVSGTQNHYVDNQAWKAADPFTSAGWDGLYVNHGKLWGHGYEGYSADKLPSVPRVTTETGWDSKSNFGGEETQGKILLNTYLSQFKQGWKYTFIYMLRDGEGGSGNQGVFNKDSSPKLAAKYIHNFTKILNQKENIESEQSLLYSIENRSDAIHDLLLQNKTDEFLMVVWGEKVSGLENIIVKMKSNVREVKIYDPTISQEPLSSLHDTKIIPLSISDYPIVIKIIN